MNTRGYQAYKEQSVNTMTKGEMLLLLYDEMLKRLSRADMALDKKDYMVFDQSVARVSEIVNYLVETLDFNYSVSKELKRMYDYFYLELSRLKAGRNREVIINLQALIRELKDAFAQADRESNR